MPTTNHYKVLQVDPEAEAEVIQAAYRRLARKYHPDVAGDADSAARMAAINAAWAILRDPIQRARYDRESLPLRVDAPAAAGTPGSPPVRPAVPPPKAAAPRRPEAPNADGPTPQRRDPRTIWGEGPASGTTAGGAGMSTPSGYGAAGPPPGNPAGSVLNFGRYAGWSLGEVARRDPQFLEWLDRMPIGRPYRNEIDRLLRGAGLRAAPVVDPRDRRDRRR
jgi:curved DNA-binding protein CbpA